MNVPIGNFAASCVAPVITVPAGIDQQGFPIWSDEKSRLAAFDVDAIDGQGQNNLGRRPLCAQKKKGCANKNGAKKYAHAKNLLEAY